MAGKRKSAAMKAPELKRVPGGYVVTAGYVPRSQLLLWVAGILGTYAGKAVEPPGAAEPSGLRIRVRPAEKRLLDHV